jgi:drug/metabolite transporter (DMT)-like permease
MTNLLLYCASTLIWGSTWLAIQYQIGSVNPAWSVVYRFAIAAVLLIGFCLLKRYSLRFNPREHAVIALQGLLLFSINYILYYYGSAYFISGVIAVIFASIIIMNIINSRLIFGTPIVPRVIIGACIGLCGLAVIFWSEITGLDLSHLGYSYVFIGLAINLIATYLASLGNMISTYTQKRGLPVLQTNALGMAYGTVFSLLVAIIFQEPLRFDPTITYIASLFYLAIFGSIFAFGCYLKLLGRIGPERAAYTFVFIPIIAMSLSTIFEEFHWTLNTFIGTGLVLCGNILVLTKKKVVTQPLPTTPSVTPSAATSIESA